MADAGISVTPCKRIHQQARVYKLVREERIIRVGEERSPFYGPGRRVNLVVERQQLPAGNLRLRGAIKGIDGELRLLASGELQPGPGCLPVW